MSQTNARIVWLVERKDESGFYLHEDGTEVANVFNAGQFHSPMRAASMIVDSDRWVVKPYKLTIEESK